MTKTLDTRHQVVYHSVMTKLENILPSWLNLDSPDGGTVEYLRRELGKYNDPVIRGELAYLIDQVERKVEARRRAEMNRSSK